MGSRAQRHRTAGGRAVAVGAVAAAAVTGAVAVAGCSSGSDTSGTPVAFAPYVDTSVTPAYDLAHTLSSTGVKEFNLGFVNAAGSDCDPMWAGRIALADDKVASQIRALRAKGGDVRVSFGGQTGKELAGACSSASALAGAYGKVIDAYKLTKVDFDIEGDAVSDADANTRRAQAIAQLQKDHPTLEVSLTLPVETDGLDHDAVAVVENAKQNGVKVGTVNIMTMDYGDSMDGDMEKYAVASATAAQKQLKTALGLDGAAAWKALSVTPMIGVNDVASETFTADDAKRLVDFARSKGIGRLSLWSANRDRECPGGPKDSADPACSSVSQKPMEFTDAFAAAASS
jgi:chitinase